MIVDNEDWLKARTWDLPTDVTVLEQQLGYETTVKLLDLPAGQAMPASLRRAIEKLRDAGPTPILIGRPSKVERRASRVIGDTKDFSEDDHPRDEGGRFASAAGGGSGGDAKPAGAVAGTQVGTTGRPSIDMLSHQPVSTTRAAEIAAAAANLPPVSDPTSRAAALEKVMNDAVANGQATQEMYDHLGNQQDEYTPERQAEHQAIVDQWFAEADARGVPKDGQAVMMGGLPGAGKTSSTGSIMDSSRYVEVNPDPLKQALLDRGLGVAPAGVNPLEGAALIHEESSYLSKVIAERAISQGYNVLWDGTMASPGAMDARFALLDDVAPVPYHVSGVFVDVPISESVSSVVDRYARGLERDPSTARYVVASYIRQSANPPGSAFESKNRATFETLKGRFDQWALIDNTAHAGRVADTSPGALDSTGHLVTRPPTGV